MATRAATKSAVRQVAFADAAPAPVVLVSGREDYLAARATALIRERLKADDPALEISDVDAADYAPGLLATLASPSLFGETRLIRAAGAERASDAFIEDALEYAAHPARGAVLVLRHAGGNRGKKLLDAVRRDAGALEVVCSPITRDADRQDFAAREFARAKKKVSPAALRALTSAFSADIAELAAACGQLIADTSGEVTEQTVDRYYEGRVETTAFKVVDAAVAGRSGEAVVLLRHALASGADPVPLVAAFASKVRTMTKVAGTRGGKGQVAAALGLAPWQVERARRDLTGWSRRGLGESIELIAQTDHEVKGAGSDPVFAVERMVLGVCRRAASR